MEMRHANRPQTLVDSAGDLLSSEEADHSSTSCDTGSDRSWYAEAKADPSLAVSWLTSVTGRPRTKRMKDDGECQSPFKQKKKLDARKKEADDIRVKYPDRIPVICDRSPNFPGLPELEKRKFLVPAHLTVCQLYGVIRQRLDLDKAISLYLQCGNTLLCSGSCLARVDADFRSVDGFLYIQYSGQETFG